MITILYEDQRGERKEFGLHRFVCQLVVDRLGLPQSVFDVERNLIVGMPLKGNGNVRKRCQNDLVSLARRSSKVFAGYDEDHVPELLKRGRNVCRPLMCQELKSGCDPLEKLDVVLVRQNQECLIGAIQNSRLVASIGPLVFQRACQKSCWLATASITNVP